MPRDLLLGCGSRWDWRFNVGGRTGWGERVTLDIVPTHQPDVVHDLRNPKLPFADDEFDSIHAYEVLEHIGPQGDAELMLAQFSEYWRILKPGGFLCATCPSWRSMWAWGDPSHSRVFNRGTLYFFSQAEYTKQVGKTPMTDFRYCYRADFDLHYEKDDGESFVFALQAVKPSRIEPRFAPLPTT
ncbi:MAG TPA: class I SAM-dependent methyltransferase [Polyangiaceae bacterium]